MDIDEETSSEYRMSERDKFLDAHLAELEDYFFNTHLEQGGIPVTKDNAEDMFDNWACDLELEDLKNIVSDYLS